MASTDRFNSRRKLYAQLAVVLVLILFALLKPRIQPWLDQNFPELAAEGRGPAAERVERSEAGGDSHLTPSVVPDSQQKGPAGRATEAESADRRAESEIQNSGRAPTGVPVKEYITIRRTGASDSRESGDEPPPGQLKLIGKNVFRSTAGLVYRPGSPDGHRLKHILKHARDDLQKPVHGVFEGDRDAILRWIDVAWIRAGKGGKLVRKRRQNDRTAWTVNMQERIGYTGGKKGQSGRKSQCQYLRLVLEDDGETVVTAYPVSSF